MLDVDQLRQTINRTESVYSLREIAAYLLGFASEAERTIIRERFQK